MDMQIIDAGIIHGFETLIKICGYIILFSIFCEMLPEHCRFRRIGFRWPPPDS